MKPLLAALLLSLTVSALAAPKKAEKAKAPPPEADSFDPVDAEAAKEYGVSAAKIKKLEDRCKKDFRDPLCKDRAKAKAEAKAAKEKAKKDAAKAAKKR